MHRRGFSRLLVAATAALVLTGGAAAGSVLASVRHAKHRPARIGARHLVQIKLLSTRADLVSGGEALTQIVVPAGTRASRIRVELGKRDVSRQFAIRANGKLEGLITGLRLGANPAFRQGDQCPAHRDVLFLGRAPDLGDERRRDRNALSNGSRRGRFSGRHARRITECTSVVHIVTTSCPTPCTCT